MKSAKGREEQAADAARLEAAEADAASAIGSATEAVAEQQALRESDAARAFKSPTSIARNDKKKAVAWFTRLCTTRNLRNQHTLRTHFVFFCAERRCFQVRGGGRRRDLAAPCRAREPSRRARGNRGPLGTGCSVQTKSQTKNKNAKCKLKDLAGKFNHFDF